MKTLIKSTIAFVLLTLPMVSLAGGEDGGPGIIRVHQAMSDINSVIPTVELLRNNNGLFLKSQMNDYNEIFDANVAFVANDSVFLEVETLEKTFVIETSKKQLSIAAPELSIGL